MPAAPARRAAPSRRCSPPANPSTASPTPRACCNPLPAASSSEPVIGFVPGDEARQADGDRNLRLVAEIAPRGFDIGETAPPVAGLHPQQPLLRGAAERRLEHGDVV